MSELQKWITSISGAVVGQIAVLAFFYLLVINPGSPRFSANAARIEPREVTVMLSQIKEQAREELPEPEAAETEKVEEKPAELPPEEEDIFSKEKGYINTDSNTARAEAPENARFESDRNTTASTEFLPNPDLPQVAGPTMKGEDKLKAMNLANQEYSDGEILPNATPPPSSSQPPTPPAEQAPPAEEMKDTPPAEQSKETAEETEAPADELSEGEAEEAKPGEADTPPDRIAEEMTQPETEKIGEEAQMAITTKSFVDPSNAANAMKVPSLTGEKDQEAVAEQKTDEFGEPAAPEEKKEIKAAPMVVGESIDKIKEKQAQAMEKAVRQKLDESMFNPAYLAHRRKNNQNGDITNIGESAVDAVATETGKYKRSVEQAIGRRWHQYRQERADQVTWGFLRVTFIVTKNGNVRNLIIEKKEATELVTEFSLRAIVDAKIPPMPDEVAAHYGARGLKMHYNIQIY
ncbi:MAG: hypothetical protein P1V20_28070 [Verrucomicrobiales bacterium]|nr:hypothetical protein [Verrucomicrobiales bacterium]